MSEFIHPSAVVHPSATIAADVIIGPYAIIDEEVIIGAGSRIDAHASIKAFTRMGTGNHIHSYASVGGVPQDLKFHGEETWLELGDNNRIREFVTISRGTGDGGGLTKIGSHNLIMAYAHIAHDCVVGDYCVFSNAATLAGHVQVHDHAILGGLCAVHQFCRIGKYAFIGGTTGVGQDVPPYMMAVGGIGPHSIIPGPNMVGIRRMGVSKETLSAIREAYKIIWLDKIPRQAALEKVEKLYTEIPEVQEIVSFIRGSQERGILPSPDRRGL